MPRRVPARHSAPCYIKSTRAPAAAHVAAGLPGPHPRVPAGAPLRTRTFRTAMNATTVTYYLLAMLAGILGGIHVPINGALGARIHSPLVATFSFYGIGFLVIALVCAVTYDRAAFSALATAPRWYFVAGVISVLVVSTNTYLIPRIGAVNLFVVVLSLQLIARMVISHFGWLDSPVSSITALKLAGCLLLMGGAVLVVRY